MIPVRPSRSDQWPVGNNGLAERGGLDAPSLVGLLSVSPHLASALTGDNELNADELVGLAWPNRYSGDGRRSGPVEFAL